MGLRIEKPGKLAADQQFVFERLSARLRASDADAAYDAIDATEDGKIISVDTARLLSPEFRSWSGRIRHTVSTGSPAGAYAHDRLLRELRRPRKGSTKLTITAGGAGSGKTSQLKNPTSAADLVFDNQFKDLARARDILRSAIRHGWQTEVVFVYRPFPDVIRAVIERSQRTGRWNALVELADAHAQAQRTIVSLWREFREDVLMNAVYNASDGAGTRARGSRLSFRDFAPGGPYHFSPDEITHSLIKDVLNKALAEGIVCRQVAWIVAKGLHWKPKK